MSFRRLWIGFAAVVITSFAVLGWIGTRIYQEAPPIPDRVVTADGTELIGPGAIQAGQNVWQSLGGMEVGSVWGHGSYVAPDWTADWLHREAIFILDRWAQPSSGPSTPTLDGGAAGRSFEGRLATAACGPTPTTRPRGRSPSIPIRAAGVRGEPRALRATCSRNGTGRVRHPGGRGDRPRPPAAAVGLLLLDRVGRVHEPARRQRHLHEQLAVRAAGRQPAHRRGGRLDRREHHHAAGGHRGDGLVVRRPQGARRSMPPLPDADPLLAVGSPRRRSGRPSSTSGSSSALILVQMLLGVVDGALRRRGGRLLRHPARRTGCRTA